MNLDTNHVPDLRNAYSGRYEDLRHSVLDVATNTWDALDCAAIELVVGYFQLFEEADYPDVWNGYEALRYLHDTGVLDTAVPWFEVPDMHRHDVAFGLALHENEVANFLFSDSIAAHGWKQGEARKLGLRAAISATECFMWGLALKAEWLASHPNNRTEECRGEGTPQYWVFRAPRNVSPAIWRRPRVVWQAPQFHTPSRPMVRPMTGSRQLKAMAATLDYFDSTRRGHAGH